MHEHENPSKSFPVCISFYILILNNEMASLKFQHFTGMSVKITWHHHHVKQGDRMLFPLGKRISMFTLNAYTIHLPNGLIHPIYLQRNATLHCRICWKNPHGEKSTPRAKKNFSSFVPNNIEYEIVMRLRVLLSLSPRVNYSLFWEAFTEQKLPLLSYSSMCEICLHHFDSLSLHKTYAARVISLPLPLSCDFHLSKSYKTVCTTQYRISFLWSVDCQTTAFKRKSNDFFCVASNVWLIEKSLALFFRVRVWMCRVFVSKERRKNRHKDKVLCH